MKLFIDSSTDYLYIGLVDQNNNILTYINKGKKDHSETLIEHLQSFLKQHNYQVTDINSVFVGRGPGSYTGIRIAGTVLKVFAYLKKTEFYSFSSLDLLIANKIKEDGKYISKIIAKKAHSYVKIVTIENEKINIIKDETFLEDTLLTEYQDYQILEYNEETLSNINIENIIKYNLYQKEDYYTYVPNYMRSVL